MTFLLEFDIIVLAAQEIDYVRSGLCLKGSFRHLVFHDFVQVILFFIEARDQPRSLCIRMVGQNVKIHLDHHQTKYLAHQLQ